MTALSFQAPPQPSQFGRRQNATQFSRNTTAAASVASSPVRNPGSFPRQTVLAMSHLHAQYAEATAPRTEQNGSIRSVSPGHPPLRPGQPTVNGRRRNTSPAPALRRPSSAPGDQQGGPLTHTADGSDEEHNAIVARPTKPPLLRSKSERGIRHEEAEVTDEEHYEWGARHGFEDHYQSEDIISQLANVSHCLLRLGFPSAHIICSVWSASAPSTVPYLGTVVVAHRPVNRSLRHAPPCLAHRLGKTRPQRYLDK